MTQRVLLLVWAGLVLGACSTLDDWVFGGNPEPGARPLEVAALDRGERYPPVSSVPRKPQLSYTVRQEREIVDALVSDRENARYTGSVIRYRSGVSAEPPPAPPAGAAELLRGDDVIGGPAPEAAAPPTVAPGEAAYAGARSRPSEATQFDDGGLDDFVRGLVDETEAEPSLRTEAAVIHRRERDPSVPGRKGQESAFERLFFWIGEQFSQDDGADGERPAPKPAPERPTDAPAPEATPPAEGDLPKLKPDESADPPEPAPAKPDEPEQGGRAPTPALGSA